MNEAMATGDLLTPPVPMRKMITSHDIKLGIKRSRGEGYQTFFEVGNDTGTKVTRHADAVSIGIWPSTGHQVHGFEVKVSRGDFLNEMKDPGKSMPVFKHCHRWSLATPPGLVKVDELPPNWGLVTFDGNSMRAVKQAPLLTPEPLTPGFVAALVRRAGEADTALIQAAVTKAKAEWQEQVNRDHEYELKRRKETISSEGAEAVKIVAALKELLGETYLSHFQIPEIVAAMKVVQKMNLVSGWGGVEAICTAITSAHDNIRKAMDDAGIEYVGKKRR